MHVAGYLRRRKRNDWFAHPSSTGHPTTISQIKIMNGISRHADTPSPILHTALSSLKGIVVHFLLGVSLHNGAFELSCWDFALEQHIELVITSILELRKTEVEPGERGSAEWDPDLVGVSDLKRSLECISQNADLPLQFPGHNQHQVGALWPTHIRWG